MFATSFRYEYLNRRSSELARQLKNQFSGEMSLEDVLRIIEIHFADNFFGKFHKKYLFKNYLAILF